MGRLELGLFLQAFTPKAIYMHLTRSACLEVPSAE